MTSSGRIQQERRGPINLIAEGIRIDMLAPIEHASMNVLIGPTTERTLSRHIDHFGYRQMFNAHQADASRLPPSSQTFDPL